MKEEVEEEEEEEGKGRREKKTLWAPGSHKHEELA